MNDYFADSCAISPKALLLNYQICTFTFQMEMREGLQAEYFSRNFLQIILIQDKFFKAAIITKCVEIDVELHQYTSRLLFYIFYISEKLVSSVKWEISIFQQRFE